MRTYRPPVLICAKCQRTILAPHVEVRMVGGAVDHVLCAPKVPR